MNNKNGHKVLFSAAKFQRLPTHEKLAYLREAFSATRNGMQVLERRHAPPRAPLPEAARVERNALFRAKGAAQIANHGGMLSLAQFDQLTLENKVKYLASAFRDLKRSARRPPAPVAK